MAPGHYYAVIQVDLPPGANHPDSRRPGRISRHSYRAVSDTQCEGIGQGNFHLGFSSYRSDNSDLLNSSSRAFQNQLFFCSELSRLHQLFQRRQFIAGSEQNLQISGTQMQMPGRDSRRHIPDTGAGQLGQHNTPHFFFISCQTPSTLFLCIFLIFPVRQAPGGQSL